MAAEMQTVSAAMSVAKVAWDTWEFFKRVKDADSTASKLCDKTQQLGRSLEAVRDALCWKEEQRTRKLPLPSEGQIERNIRASIIASEQVLLKIDRKLKDFETGKGGPLSDKALVRVKLVLKQPAVARHEHDLDIHIQALQTSIGALQLFGHAETHTKLVENHGENLARFVRLEEAIQRANALLLRLSNERPSPDLEPDDLEVRDGVQTLRECISTAETIRDTFESVHDPDGQSLIRFSGNDEDEVGDAERDVFLDLDDPKSDDASKFNSDSVGADELDGHPNPDRDEPTPLIVLSSVIEDLKKHAQKDLDAGHSKRAEMHLVEAIKLAEEQENRHGTPFKDRVEVQEKLAVVYQKQMKWAEARKILHGLLQEDDGPEAELPPEKALQRPRQYLQLATVYLEMYQARLSNGNPQEAADLRAAERFAKLAFNRRYNLHGAMFEHHEPSLLDSVQVLTTIYEAQGRTVLAESYHRLIPPTWSTTNFVPDVLLRQLSGTSGFEFVDVDKEEMFVSAIRMGDQNLVQSLLSTVDVNCRCSKGRTPLMLAVEQESEVTVRKLLDHGAEINATTAQGTTPLHQAVAKGNGRMACLLLELDADVEAKDAYRATPLLRAVEKNHGLMINYLLGHNANVHVKDRAGWTLLHHAAHNGAVDVLKQLLYPSHEMDVNATCPAGKTALHYCAELTKIDAAKVLLEHGANVNALDASSRSPLFFAVSKACNQEREQFAIMLLKNGAVVDKSRLPARHRWYVALQNPTPSMRTSVSSSTMRRGSGGTGATSSSTTSDRSWTRRFSLTLNRRHAQH